MRTRIVAVIALAFFFTPIGLRAVGVTARPFENRRMAEAPRLGQGWAFFDQATRFFIDRMPLREQAVRANTWISLNVFDTPPDYGNRHQDVAGAPGFAGKPEPATPTPEPAAEQPAAPAPAPPAGDTAVIGKDGWLYLQGELNRPCEVFIDLGEAMRRWRRLAAVVRRSGRRAVVAIAPDKASIAGEHLPDGLPQRQCQDARPAQWEVMSRPDRGIATAWDALAGRGAEVYKRKDSHWNTLGASVLLGAALEKLGRRVRVRDEELRRTSKAYTGDLTNLLGRPEEDTTTEVAVTRQPDAPRLRGRTLLVHDSYGIAFQEVLRPYTEELVPILWVGTPVDQLIAAIRDADNVIFETVEREVMFRASDGGILTPAFFDALEAALASGG